MSQTLRGTRVIAPGALELERERLVAARSQSGGVLLMAFAADSFDEGRKALGHAGGFQLIAEDGRERQRQRSAVVEQVE
jgi:hypothetical protein